MKHKKNTNEVKLNIDIVLSLSNILLKYANAKRRVTILLSNREPVAIDFKDFIMMESLMDVDYGIFYAKRREGELFKGSTSKSIYNFDEVIIDYHNISAIFLNI